MASFSDAVRQAIRRCGLTQGEICERAGIQQAVLSRFMGGSDVKISTIDKIADIVELSIVSYSERERVEQIGRKMSKKADDVSAKVDEMVQLAKDLRTRE